VGTSCSSPDRCNHTPTCLGFVAVQIRTKVRKEQQRLSLSTLGKTLQHLTDKVGDAYRDTKA
jgi:hypothetical protein